MKRKDSKVEIKNYRFRYRLSVKYSNDTTVDISFTTKSQINMLRSSIPLKVLTAANTIAFSCDDVNDELHPLNYVLTLIRKEIL